MHHPPIELSSLLCACAAVVPLLFLCATAPAQRDAEPAPPRDPELEALLDRIDAARGPSALRGKPLIVEGTFTIHIDGQPGQEPISKGRFHETFGDALHARHVAKTEAHGVLERGSTADVVYELDPMTGPVLRTGAGAAALRRYFGVVRGADLRIDGAAIALAEKVERDGRACLLLRRTPMDGKIETFVVDAETARVVEVETTLPSSEDMIVVFDYPPDAETKVTFSDWREVAGIHYPHARKVRMGGMVMTFACTKVVPDAKPAADAFELPKSVAALQRAIAKDPNAGTKQGYQVVDRDVQPVASIRTKIAPDQITATLSVAFPEVLAHLNALGVRTTGAPFTRYHAFGADTVDLEIGIPVAAPFEAKGRVVNSELPAGKTIVVWHLGPYDKLGPAHEALVAHATKEKWKPRGGAWEVYWTDPGMVTDPARWRTQLFLPVER